MNVVAFLRHDARGHKGTGREFKSDHYKHNRVAIQESSPQNNFRRIIAAPIARGEFCNHTINYCPEHRSTLAPELLLAILNSKLAEWYFRLGSTNAHVSHYQLATLPCPVFAAKVNNDDEAMYRNALQAVEARNFADARDALASGVSSPPFSPSVLRVIVDAVQRICAIEQTRGEISRSDRSALAPDAQPYQDLIDKLFYCMAGLTDVEAAGLEDRLSRML